MLPVIWVFVTLFFLIVSPVGIYCMQIDKIKSGVKRDTQTNEEFGMWPRKYWIERIESLQFRQELVLYIVLYIVLTIATFPTEIYQAILNAFQTFW